YGLVGLGGKVYGIGCSRDSAAIGSNLLGVHEDIAEIYDRVHCSKLVMIGILRFVFEYVEHAEQLGLDCTETIDIQVDENVSPNDKVPVTATHPEGKVTNFNAVVRFDSDVEKDYYRNGGILQLVLRERMEES